MSAHVAFAAEFYVSPTASASGTGTIGSPWKLHTALDHPSAVQPGDTIWLRGGTYTGAPFRSDLVGTPANPIIVRQYPGERAIIDGNYNGNETTLVIVGKDTWYWGFEIFNSDPTRFSSSGSPPRRGTGIQLSGMGTRLINMIVHDTSQGVITGESATGARIYGNLFYYNGYDAPDRGHGHGIYAQNVGTTLKPIYDNIIFRQFGWGIHAYGEGGHLDNLDFQGNVSFNNGQLTGGWHTNILVGGQTHVTKNPKLISNYTYNTNHQNNNNLGYNAGCTSPTITNNYFASSTALGINDCTSMSITGNTFYGSISGFSQSGFPSNTYYSTRPTGVKVFVRPNAYEAKRAHIVIYNWDLDDSVSVDVSSILSPGDGYEVRNAADFFGAPVLTGTYSGGSIDLPMDNLSVATPVGVGAPAPTGPEFNAFVLLPASGGGSPSPTPTTTAVPTFTATRTATPLPPTATRTPTHTSTAVPPTATWTATALPPTATRTPTAVPPTATGTPTHTATAAPPTATATRTATSVPPTATRTPSNTTTAVPPTATATRTATPVPPTATRTPSNTTTAVPPTATATRTATPVPPTATRTPSNTTTAVPPTATRTATPPPTSTRTPTRTPTAQPPGSTPTPTPGTGLMRIEAEAGAMTGPMVAAASNQAFGGLFIHTSTANTGTAKWNFTIQTPGDYVVWCRARAISAENNTFFVRADNGPEDVYDVTETPGVSWRWTRVNGRGGTGVPRTINPRIFTFSPGSHSLRFRGRDPLTRVDRVIVTDDFDYVPTEGNAYAFRDVMPASPFFDFVEALARNEITSGCGSGFYCPESPVTRAQMAVMLLKAKYGSDYVPPAATGTVFSDVARTSFAAAWIEQLAEDGITNGCGGGRFCPNATVTRAQMAIFLLRSEHGADYEPPNPTGIFDDLDIDDAFTPWIERLYVEGITTGCGVGIYCPNAPNKRSQMAVFLTRTFDLP